MSALKWAVTGIAVAALTGCGGGGLRDARTMKPAGSAFDKGLYAGYVGLAESEYREGDYMDADAFARRASAAARGEAPAPEKIAMRRLPEKNAGELAAARGRLTAALAKGAAAKAPGHASRAQVMFDCWMQEQEENFQQVDVARCRTEFFAAMAQAEAAIEPAPAPKMAKPAPEKMRRQFVVYFRLDSAALTPTTRKRIMAAAAEARRVGAKRVYVSGFADTTGTDRYNLALSEERAAAVADALVKDGVSSKIVGTGAFGEGILSVETKDGILMPDNRRVTIDVFN